MTHRIDSFFARQREDRPARSRRGEPDDRRFAAQKRRAVRPFIVFAVFAGAAVCGLAQADSGRLRPAAAAAVTSLQAELGAPVTTRVSTLTGLVTSMKLPAQGYASELAATAPAEERARAFLDRHGLAFGIERGADLALVRPPATDRRGMEHVRFRQLLGGVPVAAGELTVHLRDGRVTAVLGETLDSSLGLDTRPSSTADSVTALARVAVSKVAGTGDFELSVPRLEVLHTGLLDERPAEPRLAWFVEARNVGLQEFLWIDDLSGRVLLQFSQLAKALFRDVYDAASGSELPGTLVRTEGDPATGDADIDAAFDYSGDSYDYFWLEHGRDSFDGTGAALISTVRYCLPAPAPCPLSDAFWNGIQMVYGEGFALADDVDAHELTHAVTEYSANLFYYMQSGALNESFSDIFGEVIDLGNGAGSDDPADRWLIGEDLPIGAIRNMQDPNAFGHPARVGDPLFLCEAEFDQGGVHINSGIANHAFALMVDGGAFNGQVVTGVGLSKAGKVAYRVLNHYLTSGSGFHQAYDAFQLACLDLVGSDGITAGDCQEIEKALDAVEMDHDWPCTPLQSNVPPACPEGETPEITFFEDFESGDGNWSVALQTGPDPWLIIDFLAAGGTMSLWGADLDVESDSRFFLVPPVVLPADALLHVEHGFSFETSGGTFWDGGVMEYSTDGGVSWHDASSLVTAGADYNATLSGDNPLGAVPAFGGPSYGYTATALDLSTLAGQDFQIGFRIGTDSSQGDLGWTIDNLSIHRCHAGGAIFEDGFESGDTLAWSETSP